MRTSFRASTLLFVAMQVTCASAFAQQLAMALSQTNCPSGAPDSIQVSWTEPCKEDGWVLDPKAGCRMWDWQPDSRDRAVWSGSCSHGQKDGLGVVQWFERGQRIDSFEGTYRGGKREGIGRYVWNEESMFEGEYANDIPNGFGTVNLFGETFAGHWKNGCLRQGSRVIAIGVERTTCGKLSAQKRLSPASLVGE